MNLVDSNGQESANYSVNGRGPDIPAPSLSTIGSAVFVAAVALDIANTPVLPGPDVSMAGAAAMGALSKAGAMSRGKASEARKLAEIGASRNTRASPTSTGPRIRDGTKPDGNHVEVKDTKRVDATQQLRGLDEAAGRDGVRLEVHTGTNTNVSRNINSDTMPNTDIVRCPTLGPQCR